MREGAVCWCITLHANIGDCRADIIYSEKKGAISAASRSRFRDNILTFTSSVSFHTDALIGQRISQSLDLHLTYIHYQIQGFEEGPNERAYAIRLIRWYRHSGSDLSEVQLSQTNSHPMPGAKRCQTTTPDRIRKWSPTLLLTGRYPGYLRRSDGMRSFLDSMVVDDIYGLSIFLNRTQSFKKWKPLIQLWIWAYWVCNCDAS